MRRPRGRASTTRPLGAVVAVVEGQPEHAAIGVQQRVVAAPGVDPDARERAVLCRPSQSLERLLKQRGQVPMQPIRQPQRPIGEAVSQLDRDPVTRRSCRRRRGRSQRRDPTAAKVGVALIKVKDLLEPVESGVRRGLHLEHRCHLCLPARVDVLLLHRCQRGLEVVGLRSRRRSCRRPSSTASNYANRLR